jgi:DDE superfamily endonuclease
MTRRLPCPVAPGPLEGYAVRFDDLFGSLAQRRGFREYLAGLLAPRDRNKTLTALAGAEPVAGAQHRSVQRLQFFLSESRWDPELVNARRLELLLADPATAPHAAGVLVIDDSGDRKDGSKTAHVGHQWLGRYGKTDSGVVTVTTVWADERLYYPLHAVPYTPARHFARGKSDPGFRTKLAIGADLAVRARDAGFTFRAVAADSAYGDQDGFRGELAQAGLPFVMALKPRHGTWAYGPDAHTPADAARVLAWGGPEDPGDWQPVTRAFRDGHTETWWAADATLGWWGPAGTTRLVIATADPGTLPDKATWYLATNLPRPGGPREGGSPHLAADLAEIVRIYGIGTGSSRATSRSKTSWAGLTSRSAPTSRSAGTKCWSTARSASAGTPGSLITRRTTTLRHRSRNPAVERGGPPAAPAPPPSSWPRAIRAVRAWLSPWIALQRWWAAWSKAPPPRQLQELLDSVSAGHGLHLYVRD